MTPNDQPEPRLARSDSSERLNRIHRFAPVMVPLLLIAILLGPHLLGLRSLAPTDLLFQWEPWRSEQPADLTPTDDAPLSDNFDSIIPARSEVVERMRSGDWPLWSPLAGGGNDLAINIGTGAAAPSNLVALSTPAYYTLGLLKALELFAAWGFVFLFLRRVDVSRLPAALAGAVFALSGFQVVWVNWPHTRVAALVAGVLWSFDRVIERASPGRVALAAVLLASAVLEGFPAVAAIGVGAVTLVLLFRLAQLSSSPFDALKRASGAGAAAALGAALTAVVTLPFASRLQVLGFDRAVPPDAPIARGMGTILAPNALGRAGSYFGPLNYIEVVGYLGAGAMIVTAAGVVVTLVGGRFRPRDLMLLGTAAAGSLMLLYSYGVEPLYDMFRGLPVLSMNPAMRVKATALLFLSLSAGLSVDRLLRAHRSSRERWVATVLVVAAPVAIAVYLWTFVRYAEAGQRGYIRGEVIRAIVVAVLAAAAVMVISIRSDRRGRDTWLPERSSCWLVSTPSRG